MRCATISTQGMLIVTAVLCVPTVVLAQSDPVFSYQGQLKDEGVPVNGVVYLDFTLWDSPSGGSQIGEGYWTWSGVSVVDGLFTVEVDAMAFGPNAFRGEPRWLQITITDDQGMNPVELNPRQSITPAPYALYAFDGAGGGGGDAYWQSSGSDIFYTDGNVGVGNDYPWARLNVLSSDGNPAVVAENEDSGTSATLGHASSGVVGYTMSPEGAGVYGSNMAAGPGVWGHSSSPDGYAGMFTGRGYFSDDLGVGRVPSERLDVAGTVRMDGFQLTDSPNYGYVLTADDTGVGTWQPAGAGSSMWDVDTNGINYHAGNVGIGADSHSWSRLKVDGSALRVIHAHNGNASAQTFALYAEADSILARAVFGDATADFGQTVGVFGRTMSSEGYGVFGDARSSTGAATGVFGRSEGENGYGGYFQANGDHGFGVYGEAASAATGYAGYFVGRGYFSNHVGIGTATPTSPLTVAGFIESTTNGFKFPDGSVQTTAGGGGGGDSVWLPSGSGIFYDDGDVGIGTDNPDGQLHVVNPISNAIIGECFGENTFGGLGHEFAGVYGTGNYAVMGESTNGSGYGVWGHNYSTTGYNNSIGVFGSSDNDSGTGVHGRVNGSGGRAVWGRALGASGRGVYGEALAPSGTTHGVEGYVVSPSGYALYGFNEAESGDAVGIKGESASPTGIGVKGVGDGEYGRGVVGLSYSDDGYAGYFNGRGYFSSDVGIGTEDPWYPLHVARTDGATAVFAESDTEDTYAYLAHESTGVEGHGPGSGVSGICTSSDGEGVYGEGGEYGVRGNGESCGVRGTGDTYGVQGYSPVGIGVEGKSGGSTGVGVSAVATHSDGTAMRAMNTAGGTAVYAEGAAGGIGLVAKSSATAAKFYGHVNIYDYSTESLVIELGKGLDYAEGFDVSPHAAAIEPGTVLVIDPDHPGKLAASTEPYDRKVAGIVAGADGLGSGVRLGGDGFDHDVALAGRVYCNVIATDEPIEPGDLLTTSAVRGCAMKVTDHQRAQGAILGKAMQRLEPNETGRILVLVTLQ